MKKAMSIILVSIMLVLTITACQVNPGAGSSYGLTTTALVDPTTNPATTAAAATTVAAATTTSTTAATTPATTAATTTTTPPLSNVSITVISREEGSGTRGAFVELFGVLDENKIDQTADSAEITNSTSVMMTSVAGDPTAIGYISLGSLNDMVKAAKIDGAEATVANIKSGSYGISRPFNIAIKSGISEQGQDFVDYIMSSDGQDIIENNGYIRMEDTGAYSSAKSSGKIVVAGSSSVSPVMEKLIEAYQTINSGAEIELQTSDSSTGMKSAIDGVCDIGMASRELKDSEIDSGLQGITIATDGIAVIVNNNSPIDNLTKTQVKQIFTGEITRWSELG